MIRTLILIPVLLCSCILPAQLKLNNTDSYFYNRLIWTVTENSLTEQQLLSAPAEKVPAGFVDTLKKYNWFDQCLYLFTDKKFYSPFAGLDTTKPDLLSRQFDYFHVSATGIINREFLLKTTNNEYSFYTVTFDTTTATRVRGVSEINGSTYIIQESYGELEHLKIVSYKNRILIVDITRNGKPGEKPVMFRKAYMALPKSRI